MNEEGRPDRIDGPDDSTDGKPDGDGVGADDQNSGSGSEHDPQEELTRFPQHKDRDGPGFLGQLPCARVVTPEIFLGHHRSQGRKGLTHKHLTLLCNRFNARGTVYIKPVVGPLF